jgi:hypothetical protein
VSLSKIAAEHLLNRSQSEVEVTLRPPVSRPVRPGVRRPSGTRDQFFFLLEIFFRQLRVCYFVAPSLTRGRVCNLLLLLSLASAVPRDSRPYFIVPILETPPTWRVRSLYLYPPGTGWPSYTPGHWVPFMSPLTVEVFYPASTRVISQSARFLPFDEAEDSPWSPQEPATGRYSEPQHPT